MPTTNNITINNLTQRNVPDIPFSVIKKKILGQSYSLSIVFTGNVLSQQLNKTYRKKDKPTNVLSFPLSKNSGEIFINLILAQKQIKEFDTNYPQHVLRLFIHALLHLKGMQHGSKMNKQEKDFLNYFSLNDKKYNHGVRYRNVMGQTRRLRTKNGQ